MWIHQCSFTWLPVEQLKHNRSIVYFSCIFLNNTKCTHTWTNIARKNLSMYILSKNALGLICLPSLRMITNTEHTWKKSNGYSVKKEKTNQKKNRPQRKWSSYSLIHCGSVTRLLSLAQDSLGGVLHVWDQNRHQRTPPQWPSSCAGPLLVGVLTLTAPCGLLALGYHTTNLVSAWDQEEWGRSSTGTLQQ